VRIAHCRNTSDGKGSGPARTLYRIWMKHWIGKYARHGVAASEAAAEALFGAAWRSAARFRVLHCGIDLEPCRQAVWRKSVLGELGIPANAPVIGQEAARYRRLARVGRSLVLKMLDVWRTASEVLQIYRHTLEGKERPPGFLSERYLSSGALVQ